MVLHTLSIRLVPVLALSSEELWLRVLVGGIDDLSREYERELTYYLGPFSGSCASRLPRVALYSFCSFLSTLSVF